MNKIEIKTNYQGGFSLLELLISLAILGVILVTTTTIIMLNLTAARKIESRSYAREESAFLLNVLKKDIRNAESVVVDNENNTISVVLIEPSSNSTTNYLWRINNDRVERAENGNKTTYITPIDVEFSDVNFEKVEGANINNELVYIYMEVWVYGMPEDDTGNKLPIKKEIVVSTRNYTF